jgi:hypothetical protein
MSTKLFGQILEGVRCPDTYLNCKPAATDKIGFSSYQKCLTAIRMLAYGVFGDLVDEYMRLSNSTCLDSMYKIFWAVIKVLINVSLRSIHLHGNGNMKVARSYLRLLLAKIYGFGIIFLSWKVLLMISTCSSNL